MNFESSDRYDDRQKAALAYAQAIAWGEADLDALWSRLRSHFTEPELVELGYCIALTFGQQCWIRLLGIEHQQYLAGTAPRGTRLRTAGADAERQARRPRGRVTS